jgi:hypothetical protein
MLKLKFVVGTLTICFSTLFNVAAATDDPPVKMSKTGICHARGTSYYAQTKNYTAYNTLEECLQAGGRKPKR